MVELAGVPGVGRAPAHLRDLFQEIGDLKRIRSAGREGSVATRGFRVAWAALVAGEAPEATMGRVVAGALAATRLGDLDRAKLDELGLDEAEASRVLGRAFDAVADGLDASLAGRLRGGLTAAAPGRSPEPAFVRALAAQPRAGATCPGKPRIVLEPPENHAEHCWAVAVLGVLLSPTYGAEPTTVFLAGLAHHFHNAAMPDSGFTGEMLLGDQLGPVMVRATDAALAQLDEPLRGAIVAARRALADDRSAEGRAFHAADVIDRVMQIAQHLRPATITMATVLDELELVHDGPVKPFHDRVLAQMRLP